MKSGTFMISVAMCGGNVKLNNVNPAHLSIVTNKLLEAGALIKVGSNSLMVYMIKRPKSIDMTIGSHRFFTKYS